MQRTRDWMGTEQHWNKEECIPSLSKWGQHFIPHLCKFLPAWATSWVHGRCSWNQCLELAFESSDIWGYLQWSQMIWNGSLRSFLYRLFNVHQYHPPSNNFEVTVHISPSRHLNLCFVFVQCCGGAIFCAITLLSILLDTLATMC